MLKVVFVPAAPLLVNEINPNPSAEVAGMKRTIADALGRIPQDASIAVVAVADAAVDAAVSPRSGVAVGADAEAPPQSDGLHSWPLDAPSARVDGAARAGERDLSASPDLPTTREVPMSPELPMSLTVARALLTEVGRHPSALFSIPASPLAAAIAESTRAMDAEPDHAAERPSQSPRRGGHQTPQHDSSAHGLAQFDTVVVVGDGSAAGHEKAPGHVRPGATAYDDALAEALAHGHIGTLADLDLAQASDLLASGPPAWRLVARCCQEHQLRQTSARLLDRASPHFVTYFVAEWQLGPQRSGDDRPVVEDGQWSRAGQED